MTTNVDGPFGLRCVGRIGGGGVPEQRSYGIASGYGTSLFIGDPVQMTGAANSDNGLPQIAIAEAGNVDNIGVFMGCRYVGSDGRPKWSRYWPASTAATFTEAFVIDDPDAIFEVQTITGTAFDDAAIGQLADWSLATAGSATTGLSGAELDISSTATTGKSLRILRRVNRPDVYEAAHAKVLVTWAEHVLKGVVSGVGGI